MIERIKERDAGDKYNYCESCGAILTPRQKIVQYLDTNGENVLLEVCQKCAMNYLNYTKEILERSNISFCDYCVNKNCNTCSNIFCKRREK